MGEYGDAEGPLVSIVVPTHLSDPPYLHATLESVVAQTWPRWELVVVADGVGDTGRLDELCSLDRRIRLLRAPRGGVARARNAGLADARGDLVAFLDHDDVWHPPHLELLVGAIGGQPDAVAAFSAFYACTGPDLTLLSVHRIGPATRHSVFSGGNRPSLTTLLARRSAIATTGGFDPEFDGADDVDMVHKLAEVGPLAYVDTPTVSYRWHETNWSHDSRGVAEAGDRVLRSHLERLRRAGDDATAADLHAARRRARYHYAGAGIRDAARAARRGRPATAASLVWWSVRFSPSGALSVLAGAPRRIASRLRQPGATTASG